MTRTAIGLIGLLLSGALRAAPRSTEEEAKIVWLLAQIRDSKATFIRNGREYSCDFAATYLSRKLAVKGKNVATARDFIAKIAQRSETTGRPYEIRLPGAEATPLGPWLSERLALYEKEHPPPARTYSAGAALGRPSGCRLESAQ